jgi:hypothetical protein
LLIGIQTSFTVIHRYVALLRENALKREVSQQAKRRVKAMRRREDSFGFVLIVRMSIPLLSSAISALTA